MLSKIALSLIDYRIRIDEYGYPDEAPESMNEYDPYPVSIQFTLSRKKEDKAVKFQDIIFTRFATFKGNERI